MGAIRHPEDGMSSAFGWSRVTGRVVEGGERLWPQMMAALEALPTGTWQGLQDSHNNGSLIALRERTPS